MITAGHRTKSGQKLTNVRPKSPISSKMLIYFKLESKVESKVESKLESKVESKVESKLESNCKLEWKITSIYFLKCYWLSHISPVQYVHV